MKTTYNVQFTRRTSKGWLRNYWRRFNNYEEAIQKFKQEKENKKTSLCVLYERIEKENALEVIRLDSYFKHK